jgi:tRNA dimethylallyltransferase
MWRTRLAGERPLIVILGPTAAGKTRAAIALAQGLNGEIVGADSRQIYRHMDIGTAKPTPAEQTAARHHLIDVVDPDQTLSVAEYQRLAFDAVDDLHARGKLPLLVGGTGQYISAVIEGWSIPQVAPNDALRAELEAFAAEHGSGALHARLAAIDRDAAARIDHQNVRRVVRALEVCIETGRPISELQQKRPPPYAIVQFGVTLERSALYARADARITRMLDAGFLDEVRGLLARRYDRRLPSLSGIGYAQLVEHLLDGLPLADALEKTRTLTHDFIRRQFTWFRKHNPAVTWYDSSDASTAAMIDAARRWLDGRVNAD